MNLHRPPKPVPLSDDAKANIGRIEAMWATCRARYGQGGPFLFGAFSAADAMYAPMVSRFHTYAVEVGAGTRAYMAAVMALLIYEHGLVKPTDLSRVNAAFFTMNGWVSVLFFVFWAADIFFIRRPL